MENQFKEIHSSTPKISVVICTLNNSNSLKITANQILQNEVDVPKDFELLIIDNNSTDDTASVIEQLPISRIDIRAIKEEKTGISYARNRAINEAKGTHIIFTDDDAEIPINWLRNYQLIIDSKMPDAIFGRVIPIWRHAKPWWYDEYFSGFFAHLDYGDKNFFITNKKTPFFTKNCCINVSKVKDIGGFDIQLGRKGDSLAGGEDTLLFNQLIDSGASVYYSCEVDVGHRLKDREYQENNIIRQFLECAKPIYLIAKLQPGKRLAGRPLGLLELQMREIFKALPALLLNIITNNKKRSFYNKLRLFRAFKIILLWIKNLEP